MSVNVKPVFVAVVHLYARESVQRPNAVQVINTVEVLCGAASIATEYLGAPPRQSSLANTTGYSPQQRTKTREGI